MENGQVPGVVVAGDAFILSGRIFFHELFCKVRVFCHVEMYVLDRSSTSIHLIIRFLATQKHKKNTLKMHVVKHLGELVTLQHT